MSELELLYSIRIFAVEKSAGFAIFPAFSFPHLME